LNGLPAFGGQNKKTLSRARMFLKNKTMVSQWKMATALQCVRKRTVAARKWD
jgi:hypothetical protein